MTLHFLYNALGLPVKWVYNWLQHVTVYRLYASVYFNGYSCGAYGSGEGVYRVLFGKTGGKETTGET